MLTMMFSGFKGGCGKSTLAHHMASRAAETGLRVLVVDTDSQADLYRRLLGDDANLADCPPAEWGPGCLAVHSPDAWSLPEQADFDLVIIDTPAHTLPPEGPAPMMLVIPIDGVDAARNSNETVAWARERRVPATLLVLNGVDEGGKRHARQFDRIREHLPENVNLFDVPIPRGGSIKRSAASCRPAWKDMWPGADAVALKGFCDTVISYLRQVLAQAGQGRQVAEVAGG